MSEIRNTCLWEANTSLSSDCGNNIPLPASLPLSRWCKGCSDTACCHDMEQASYIEVLQSWIEYYPNGRLGPQASSDIHPPGAVGSKL